ncbi:hypothetical protein H0O03_04705 [Candidatus Micrarchaeota archaeon]|nr:hypothetical protein [Candidatus Micrarchaeota archaeon]
MVENKKVIELARILVVANFHPNEGGVLAARQIAEKLRGLGHEVLFEKLPFEGSHLSTGSLLEHKRGDSRLTGFRDHGVARLVRAVDRQAVDVILDVHTTDKKLFSRPNARQRDWTYQWVPPYEETQKDAKGRIAREVVLFARWPEIPGKWPSEYTLELPAETTPLPPYWKQKLAGLKLSRDDRKYIRIHKPIRLNNETAAKIARAFHKKAIAGK